MKRFLLPYLICPACLPKEIQLDNSVDKEKENDIIAGHLLCKNCTRKFPIREGLHYFFQTQMTAMLSDSGATKNPTWWTAISGAIMAGIKFVSYEDDTETRLAQLFLQLSSQPEKAKVELERIRR